MNNKMRYEILDKETCFQGFFKIVKYRISHSLFAGGMMPPIEREIFERGTAAALLPYDPNTDSVLLVEQFRIGALQEATPWLSELIAGMVEKGEKPKDVIVREALEEAGINIKEPTLIQKYLVSPGGTTEKIYLYYAEADLSAAGGLHGLAHEGEDIRVELVRPDELFRRLDEGLISNAMTLIGVQWFRHHYQRLKGQ